MIAMSVRIVWRSGTPYDEHSMMISTLRVYWPSIRSLHIASVCILILHSHHDGTSMFLRFSTPRTISREILSLHHGCTSIWSSLSIFKWFFLASMCCTSAFLHEMSVSYTLSYYFHKHLIHPSIIHFPKSITISITISSKLTHAHFIISYPYIKST